MRIGNRILIAGAAAMGLVVMTPSAGFAEPVTVERHETVGPVTVDGSSTSDGTATGAPTGGWCATHSLATTCVAHRSDGFLAPSGARPGLCAGMTTAGGPTGDKCVNARGCLVLANVDQPQGCRT